jgi:hypothetical protein
MKEKQPQFLKMTAGREETPPPREVCCPDYRNCLTEAAFKNYCLDCSQCAAVQTAEKKSTGSKTPLYRKRKFNFGYPLPA